MLGVQGDLDSTDPVEIEMPQFTTAATYTMPVWFTDLATHLTATGVLSYEVAVDGAGFEKPESWTGRRRARSSIAITRSSAMSSSSRKMG